MGFNWQRPPAEPQWSAGRARLERWQVVVYAAAVAAGLFLGLYQPALGDALGPFVWPLLAALLFATFLQISVGGVRRALAHRRFFAAVLAANFAAVPVVVWGLSWLLPDDPSIRLAFLLVLLAPCIDWFNTFSHLGKGDAHLSTAATPVVLVAQMLLLPIFLVVMVGPEISDGLRAEPFVRALLGIIVLPLVLALGIRAVASSRARLERAVSKTDVLPIPLLALVLFVVAASEAHGLAGSTGELARVALLFVAYLVAVPFIAAAAARLARLEARASRTLVFSLGSRNSFVMLPLILAWPGLAEVAVAVVVLQSLIELCGMVIYVAIIPRWFGRGA